MTPVTVFRPALWLVAPLLAAAALANCGCLLVAAGTAAGAATGLAYVNGKISATYFAFPRDVYMATRLGLNELGMPILKESFDGFKGSIESLTVEGDKVFISLECISSPATVDVALTRLSVRIANFGDRNGSERIFRQIGLHVPTDMLPKMTTQNAMPGGGGPGGTPLGTGTKPLTATTFVGAPALTVENPLTAIPPAQTILPMPEAASQPQPLADPQLGGTSATPRLPLVPVPAEQPRSDGK